MTMERQWVVGVDATEILPAPANAIGEFTASLSGLPTGKTFDPTTRKLGGAPVTRFGRRTLSYVVEDDVQAVRLAIVASADYPFVIDPLPDDLRAPIGERWRHHFGAPDGGPLPAQFGTTEPDVTIDPGARELIVDVVLPHPFPLSYFGTSGRFREDSATVVTPDWRRRSATRYHGPTFTEADFLGEFGATSIEPTTPVVEFDPTAVSYTAFWMPQAAGRIRSIVRHENDRIADFSDAVYLPIGGVEGFYIWVMSRPNVPVQLYVAEAPILVNA